MRIFYKIITKLMLMFCICLISDANANDTFTNLELQNPKIENQFKIVRVYNIVDYPGFSANSIMKDYPVKKPSSCDAKYKYSACSAAQKLNSDCCDGKCTGCISCTASAGWDYTKPNVDNSRIRATNQECGDVYYACDEGYQPQTNAINGINLISCPSHQNYISTGGGASCAKCEDKTCSDYGYQDNNDTTKNCSAISPYSGKNCYSCSNCPSNYVSCTSPQTGVGSPCGGKYSSCQCPSGVTNCSQGCKTYNTGACSSVCMECKACTPTPPAGYTAGYGSCPASSNLLTTDDGCGNPYHKCEAKTCDIGDIYYSDNSCSPNIIDGKNPIGLVYWVNNSKTSGYVMNLDQPSRMSWNSATSYCSSYIKNGITGWKIPDKSELTKMGNEYLNRVSNNKYFILNTKLSRINSATMSDRWYWSSSGINTNLYYRRWVHNLVTDQTYGHDGDYFGGDDNFYVRCILAF